MPLNIELEEVVGCFLTDCCSDMMNNQLEQVDEDDDIPQLSAQTLTALQEFYAEQAALEQQLNEAQTRDKNTRAADISVLPEDWVCQKRSKFLSLCQTISLFIS